MAQAAQQGERRISDAKAAVIFGATLSLLGEVGYEGLTVDGIAARAGVGKATIYRWWSGKAEVVVAALGDRRRHSPDVDTGSLRGDLEAAVHELVVMARNEGAVIMGVGASLAENPELAYAIQRGLLPPERARFERILARARARGEYHGTAPELAFEVVASMVFSRVLHTGKPVDNDFVEELVSEILLPLLQPPPTAP